MPCLHLVSKHHGEEDLGSHAIDGSAKHCERILVREWGRFQEREELFPSNRHHPLLRQGAECVGYSITPVMSVRAAPIETMET